jgi:hypothetical protein
VIIWTIRQFALNREFTLPGARIMPIPNPTESLAGLRGRSMARREILRIEGLSISQG